MGKGISRFALAVCAIALGIGLSLRPWRVYAQQEQSTHQQLTEMKKVQSQHIADLKEDAEISSTVGRERLARELGYHKANEVPANP